MEVKCFGPDVVDDFLRENGLKAVIRGHKHRIGGFWRIGRTLTLLTTTAYQDDEQYIGRLENGGITVYSVTGDAPIKIGALSEQGIWKSDSSGWS